MCARERDQEGCCRAPERWRACAAPDAAPSRACAESAGGGYVSPRDPHPWVVVDQRERRHNGLPPAPALVLEAYVPLGLGGISQIPGARPLSTRRALWTVRLIMRCSVPNLSR